MNTTITTVPPPPRRFRSFFHRCLFLTHSFVTSAGLLMGLLSLPIMIIHDALMYELQPQNMPNVSNFVTGMLVWGGLSVLLIGYRYFLSHKLETYQVATGDLIALELVQKDFHEALRLKIAEKMPQISIEKAADTGSKYRVSIYRYRFLTAMGAEELLFQPVGADWKKIDFENLPLQTPILYDPKNTRKQLAINFISFGRPTGFSKEGEIQFDERTALLHWLLALLISGLTFLLAYNKMYPIF